jgi:hypothetical protein
MLIWNVSFEAKSNTFEAKSDTFEAKGGSFEAAERGGGREGGRVGN